MASSSKSKKIYDVFLSFRGMDLRNSFVGHLYQALHRNGIYTFRDSDELKKGEQISLLMKAIEESCIAVIIFSENYASSTWCLEEVAKIMECKEQKDLIVLPVFYKVDPKEVRGGRKSYQKAMAKHEFKFRKDSENLKRWKTALFNVGNLFGWHLNDGDESELIQEIVKKISTYLSQTPLHVAKHPVGIDSRVVKLKSMLNLESDDGVLMAGIWGQGGIGKTSLAKALYNVIFRKFEGSCFLENVRETSEAKGLVTLQEILLNDILLPQQRLKVSNVDRGIQLIQRRLGRKKVLLILDDVDDLHQLNTLAEGKWFGNGSRIIVTTRDKHLLTCHRIDQDRVYEVKALDDSQARDMLTKHAFRTHQIRTELVDSALNYCKGLPLALEVLGSLLCGTTKDVWESTIMKLSRIPDKKINNVLKVSYDGLDEIEKEIFLHIACFFNGWTREYIKKVLDSCDLLIAVGFDTLIKRSLIRFEFGIIKVHDLIQAMGKDIVNQECQDDPRRRSRLWLYHDVADVLSRDMGDCAITAIVLKLHKPTEMHIGLEAFTKMRRLRLLILHNVHDSFEGPIYLPNELRWFEWDRCTAQIPNFSAGSKKLVGLDMSKGKITGVLKQFKVFHQLKSIKLSGCESLVRMPDFSCAPNLEELYLLNCKSLIEAHESIAYHDMLKVLHLSGCSELSVFPNALKSKLLQDLTIANCTKFDRFPDVPHKLKGLKLLYLRGTAIKELPASIENLVSLEGMYIYLCKNLVNLPSNIYKLQNIKYLYINSCTNFIGLPRYKELAGSRMKIRLSNLQFLSLVGCNLAEAEFLKDPSCFPFLRELNLAYNNTTSLPTFINKCYHLSRLVIGGCHQLQEIPKLPPFLNDLHIEGCDSLQTKGHMTPIDQWVRRWLAMVDTASLALDSSFSFRLLGREMPEWFQPVKGASISFMASKDLYDKFVGWGFCAVFGKYESHKERSFKIVSSFNGKMMNCYKQYFHWLESDVILFQYFIPSDLWDVLDFGQIDGSHAQFSLTQLSGDVQKWGFRIICKPLEDDLKVDIRENQLINPAFLYEVGHDSTYPEAESSHMHKDSLMEIDLPENLQDCQMSTQEHGQIGSKRNHGFILPQGKRIKTMLTSNPIGDENEMRLIDQLKNLHL